MVRHNNEIPNQHFHKTLWQDHVKTWFNQAARKKRRRLTRQKKAAAIAAEDCARRQRVQASPIVPPRAPAR